MRFWTWYLGEYIGYISIISLMQKKESALVPTPPFSDAGLDTVPASWLLLGEQLNALLSASRAVTARMSDSFGADLQPAAFHVVQWLHAFGPAQASQVADALAMDRSATSRLVGQLRQAGLVESRAGTADRRSVILSLTEEGSRRMQAAIAYKGEVFRHRLEGWSETDIGHLTALLRRFNSDGING